VANLFFMDGSWLTWNARNTNENETPRVGLDLDKHQNMNPGDVLAGSVTQIYYWTCSAHFGTHLFHLLNDFSFT
jgi:hypothetical protein